MRLDNACRELEAVKRYMHNATTAAGIGGGSNSSPVDAPEYKALAAEVDHLIQQKADLMAAQRRLADENARLARERDTHSASRDRLEAHNRALREEKVLPALVPVDGFAFAAFACVYVCVAIARLNAGNTRVE